MIINVQFTTKYELICKANRQHIYFLFTDCSTSLPNYAKQQKHPSLDFNMSNISATTGKRQRKCEHISNIRCPVIQTVGAKPVNHTHDKMSSLQTDTKLNPPTCED